MTIKAYQSLSEKVINEVLNLESVCIDHDNLKGSHFFRVLLER
ncbi:hypothetical protein UF75_0027 [Desulfosporosinus sp. I2]|nr:hypothetical protein UF75_0027 [Desulfosporosinus sp. I2]